MIGLFESLGFLSRLIKMIAWDQDENSFDDVGDIVRLSFPCKMIFKASAAEFTETSFSPGTWIPFYGSSMMTRLLLSLCVESKSLMFSLYTSKYETLTVVWYSESLIEFMIPNIVSIAIIPMPEKLFEWRSDLCPNIVKVFPAPVIP